MTKSWWSGGREERFIDVALKTESLEEEEEDESLPRLRQTYWTVTVVVLALLIAIGACFWLLIEVGSNCSGASDRCWEPRGEFGP